MIFTFECSINIVLSQVIMITRVNAAIIPKSNSLICLLPKREVSSLKNKLKSQTAIEHWGEFMSDDNGVIHKIDRVLMPALVMSE